MKTASKEWKIDERKKIFTDIMAESLIKTGADIKIKSENEFYITDGEDFYTVKIIKKRK